MDRDRLKDIHTTDLNESRVNEDFVAWLKAWGPTWLLVILVAVTAYLAVIRFRQAKATKIDDAWVALIDAALPHSQEDVAADHADIFAVPQIARRQAGVQLLRAVQKNEPIDAAALVDPNAPTTTPGVKLTEADRTEYLERADRLFQEILNDDDGTLGMTLHAVQALNGRAAVAESRGDVEQARSFFEAAAERAGDTYPVLRDQATSRAASASEFAKVEVLSTEAPTPPPIEPPFATGGIEPALRGLLLNPVDE